MKHLVLVSLLLTPSIGFADDLNAAGEYIMKFDDGSTYNTTTGEYTMGLGFSDFHKTITNEDTISLGFGDTYNINTG
ncbi:hypothetical protein N9X59_05055, partial [Alphaproteobacteria bacterium]|nr:hypothetical protein [Alphaproteobacteria bacterium]